MLPAQPVELRHLDYLDFLLGLFIGFSFKTGAFTLKVIFWSRLMVVVVARKLEIGVNSNHQTMNKLTDLSFGAGTFWKQCVVQGRYCSRG